MGSGRDAGSIRQIRTLFSAGTSSGLSDAQLLGRFASKDGEASELAFSTLVERHGLMVFRSCRAITRDDHLAQDASQASFLVLARKANSLWVGDSIGPWLHRVACRVATRARLAEGRRRVAERNAVEGLPGFVAGEPADDRAQVVHEEIDRLPDRYRRPVVICDLGGRTYEEAASELGCPVGTVKSRLARGRDRLRARLTRRGLAPSAGIVGAGQGVVAVTQWVAWHAARQGIRLAMGRSAPASVASLVGWKVRVMAMKTMGQIVGIGVVLGAIGMGWEAFRSAGWASGAIAATADEPKAAGPQAEVDQLEGTWVRVSTDGVKADRVIKMIALRAAGRPKAEAPGGSATFLLAWRAYGEKGWSFNRALFDPSREPKTIDMRPDGEGAPTNCPGIYKREGDILTICFRATDGVRPADFTTGRRGEIVDVYRLAKP